MYAPDEKQPCEKTQEIKCKDEREAEGKHVLQLGQTKNHIYDMQREF